ncbi:hypothetical protein EON80_13845 [bacterium]|nr:MAG: hypothetical protein EON80_13845 [bacterium]
MRFKLVHAPQWRVFLSLALMLALLPLGSAWNVSEARPPRHAPAYGYRNKRTNRDYRRPSYQRRSYPKKSFRRVPPRRVSPRRDQRRPAPRRDKRDTYNRIFRR